MKKPDKESLRIQYQQCMENYRTEDRHIWQVPSVIILIASAIVGVSFGYLKNALILSSTLLLFGIVMTLTMFVTVKKLQFYQFGLIKLIRKIEDELFLEPTPIITGEGTLIPENWTNFYYHMWDISHNK